MALEIQKPVPTLSLHLCECLPKMSIGIWNLWLLVLPTLTVTQCPTSCGAESDASCAHILVHSWGFPGP